MFYVAGGHGQSLIVPKTENEDLWGLDLGEGDIYIPFHQQILPRMSLFYPG